MFYGSVIVRFFGVLVVWCLNFIISLMAGRRIKSFTEIWKGPDNKDFANNASYEMKFIIIGVVFIFVLCWFLMKIKI